MDRQGIEPCSTAVMHPYITIQRPLYVCKGCAERIMLYSMAASKLLRFLCKHPFKNSLQTYCTDAPNQLHANICTPITLMGFAVFLCVCIRKGKIGIAGIEPTISNACYHYTNAMPITTFLGGVYISGVGSTRTGLVGFEPTKCSSQSAVPCRLAIALCDSLLCHKL